MTNYNLHVNTWTNQPVCYLEDLFVDSTSRHRALGRARIVALAKKTKADGWFTFYWLTNEDNNTSRLLYDKLATATD